MDDPDNEILNQVIEESREHLQTIEPDLLSLEESGSSVDPEVVNRIFRAVHSIKGGFGFFSKDHICKLSHTMENVLSKVRRGELSPSPAMVDVLLKGVDKLNILLDDIDNSDTIPIDQEVTALTPFVEGKAPEEIPAVEAEAESSSPEETASSSDNELYVKYPGLTNEAIKDAIDKDLHFYEVVLYGGKDFTSRKITPSKLCEDWAPVAEILSMPDGFSGIKSLKQVKKKDVFNLFIASIIEPLLIQTALEIAEDQIITVERSVFEGDEKEAEKEAVVETSTLVTPESSLSGKSDVRSKQSSEAQTSDVLRVKVSLLDNLVNLAGELVLSRNQLMQKITQKVFSSPDLEKRTEAVITSMKEIEEKLSTISLSADRESIKLIQTELDHLNEHLTKLTGVKLTDIPGLLPLMQNIDRVTSGLQENIMQTRMQPIGVVFRKFPRIIRDLSKSLGKDVELVLSGEDVELDKSIIELLSDPLTHLVRNSVDHGVEIPSARKAAHKQEKGMIYLHAYHEGGKVIIEISDDGAGINAEKVAQKALERKLISQEDLRSFSEKDLQMLIFQPGFSTAQKVSDLSGRGVGMDVVKTNIEKLGGSIEIESELGKGSRFIMKLPLTLAIIPSLLINTCGRRFAIPQVGIEELVRVRAKEITNRIHRIQGAEVLKLRDKLLPLVRLGDVLNVKARFFHPDTGEVLDDKRDRWSDRRHGPKSIGAKDNRNGNKDRRMHLQNAVKLAVLKIGSNNYGLVVDEISNSEEIVVKPLSSYLKSCKHYSGCTILGDGTVAMILDPASLAEASDLQFEIFEKEMEAEKERQNLEKNLKKEAEELLLFDNGGEENFAVPISTISRIERITPKDISMVGSLEFLKHDDYSIKLLRLHNYLPISPPQKEFSELFVLLPKGVQHPIGIVVCNIEDVLKISAVLDDKNVKGAGITGSGIIQGKMTLIMNFLHFLLEAEPELFNDN